MGIWSNLIGRKSAPVDAGMWLPPWLRTSEASTGFAHGYEAQLGEVYRTNPVGLRAVRLVAGTVGGLKVFSDREEIRALVTARGLMESECWK